MKLDNGDLSFVMGAMPMATSAVQRNSVKNMPRTALADLIVTVARLHAVLSKEDLSIVADKAQENATALESPEVDAILNALARVREGQK